ncbi:acyl carrier protein [Streptomyces sp. NPDC059176]|uniref:acyl carrier protein n=1 Tax=unclassified Streptomyces TaxID=2593676 RepID=UPI0036AF0DB6
MEEIVTWIRSKNPDLDGEIAYDTDLIESRLIASVSFMEFIGLLEELTGRSIDVSKLSVADFRTLDRINDNFFAPVA